MPSLTNEKLIKADFARSQERLDQLKVNAQAIRHKLELLSKRLSKITNGTERINFLRLRTEKTTRITSPKTESSHPVSPNRLAAIKEKKVIARRRIEEALIAAESWKQETAAPKNRPQSASLNLFRLRPASADTTRSDMSVYDKPSYFRTRFRF